MSIKKWFSWRVLLFGIFLGLIIVVSILLAPTLKSLLPTRIDALLATFLVDAFLTIMLIYLYLEFTRSQGDQTELLEKQKEWMKADHAPVITLERTRIDEDEDKIFLILSNRGNGIANNLRVITNINIYSEKHEILPKDTTLVRGTEYANYLEPNETKIRFNTTPKGGFKSKTVVIYKPYTKIFDDLDDMGYEKAEIKITLKYDDILGNTHEKEILSNYTKVSDTTSA